MSIQGVRTAAAVMAAAGMQQVVSAGNGSTDGRLSPLPGLLFHPEGDAIVVRNGTNWNNRPLYCNRRKTVVYAGEMPAMDASMGIMNLGIARGETRVMLHAFAERKASYRPGRMEWDLSDPRLPGLNVQLTGTTLADAEGYVAELLVTGAKSGDCAAWCLFPQEKDTQAANFGERCRFSGKCARIDPFDFSQRDDLSKAGTGSGFVAWIPLSDAAQYAMVAADGEKVGDPAREFEDGLARVTTLGRQVVVETPDPYFNAGVGASCAAMYGLYVDSYFAHGGSAWRMCFPGWRIMDGATAYGWHDLVAAAMKYHGERQVKTPNNKTKAEADANGAEQSGNSRFYGLGKLTTSKRYDMQTQFFDQCIRDWRATGAPAFEKQLLPMLELHLQWARECFDPDGDGLYESYINTWPTDSQWYNGGGSVEESAYIYFQETAAAEMCRRAGRHEAAAGHGAMAVN